MLEYELWHYKSRNMIDFGCWDSVGEVLCWLGSEEVSYEYWGLELYDDTATSVRDVLYTFTGTELGELVETYEYVRALQDRKDY